MVNHHGARRSESSAGNGRGHSERLRSFVSVRGVMKVKLRKRYDRRTTSRAGSRQIYLTLAAPQPAQDDWTPKTAAARRSSSVADEASGRVARYQCEGTVQPFAGSMNHVAFLNPW
jgi:hypothetical protein